MKSSQDSDGSGMCVSPVTCSLVCTNILYISCPLSKAIMYICLFHRNIRTRVNTGSSWVLSTLSDFLRSVFLLPPIMYSYVFLLVPLHIHVHHWCSSKPGNQITQRVFGMPPAHWAGCTCLQSVQVHENSLNKN